MLRCIVLFLFVCCLALFHGILYYIILDYVMLYCDLLCCVILSYVMLCHVVLRYVMLNRVVLCRDMLCLHCTSHLSSMNIELNDLQMTSYFLEHAST